MKKLFLIFFVIMLSTQTANAEKLPIKITPAQVISTHHDEIEVEDWIKFKVVNDVYYNEKLYIKKDTIVTGIVDNVHENGIIADNAEIVFKQFVLRDVNNKLVKINYTLTLNRDNAECYGLGYKIKKYIGFIFKGNEIYVKPETTTYNLFLDK